MKLIFRNTLIGLLFAAIVSIGAVKSFAQETTPDPCPDQDIAALDKKIRDLVGKKPMTLVDKKAAVESGKEFVEKYGSCTEADFFAKYVKTMVPALEDAIKKDEYAANEKLLVDKFNNGLSSKNWSDVYSAGKDLLNLDVEKYRAAEIAMGSIGLDETAKVPRVTKWNEDTLRYARQSIADLEAGKKFTDFGVLPFKYKDKEDALAWLNYTIGYIYWFDKKDSAQALPYLRKATEMETTKSNPGPYNAIAKYYHAEVGKRAAEIAKLKSELLPADPVEVANEKTEVINSKITALNAWIERTIDAYARAHKFASTNKAYQTEIMGEMQNLYEIRFNKTDGLKAWIDNALAKPIPDPTSTVATAVDGSPAAADQTASEGAGMKAPMNKPVPVVEKPMAPTAKPSVKPAGTGTKPGRR